MDKESAAKKSSLFRSPPQGLVLQRKCACGNHTVAGGKCEECDRKKQSLQRASISSYEGQVPSIVDEVLRSPGRPLDAETRSFMESRFHHDFTRVQTHGHSPQKAAREGLTVGPSDDHFEREADSMAARVTKSEPKETSAASKMNFSQVRIHTDALAAESARELNAQAYTVGNDVVFGPGQYSPQTAAGRALLAHELTHVLQQQGGSHEDAQSPPLAQRKARERTPVFSDIYDFFSNIVQAISPGFSPDTLQEYLDTIIETGHVEDSSDSDNKALEVFKLWKAGKDKREIKVGGRVFRMDDKLKKLLSEELRKGSVSDEEKQAAQELDSFSPQAAAPQAAQPAPAATGPQPQAAPPLTEGEKGAAKIREGLKGQVETRDLKGKKFQVGGVSANQAAQSDIKNNNVLLNREDTAHIEFFGNKLGVDLSYNTPRDPYRWNMLKEMIATSKVELLAVSESEDIFLREALRGQIGPKVSRQLQSLGERGARGATAIREGLYKLTAASEDPKAINFVSVTDTDQVFYSRGFASAAHELFGHAWLAMHGVPSGHHASLKGTQTIKDPFGEPYAGSVDDYIYQFIQKSPDVDRRQRPINPPSFSLDVSDQKFEEALQAFIGTITVKEPSANLTISNDVQEKWKALKRFYEMLLLNPVNEQKRLAHIIAEIKKVYDKYNAASRDIFDAAFLKNASSPGTGLMNPEGHIVKELQIEPAWKRSLKKEEGKVQRKATAPYTNRFAPPIVHEVLGSRGHPLDPQTRSLMETRFNQGLSLGHSRSHEGVAAESAQAKPIKRLAETTFTPPGVTTGKMTASPGMDCCCCVDSLAIQNASSTKDGGRYGHKFDLVGGLDYTAAAKKKGFHDCILKWEERTSRPAIWQSSKPLNIKPHLWYDAFERSPSSPTFNGWTKNRKKICGEHEIATLTDDPSASVNMGPRTLEFRLSINSTPGCDCPTEGLTVTARQELKPDGKGGIDTQSFKTPNE